MMLYMSTDNYFSELHTQDDISVSHSLEYLFRAEKLTNIQFSPRTALTLHTSYFWLMDTLSLLHSVSHSNLMRLMLSVGDGHSVTAVDTTRNKRVVIDAATVVLKPTSNLTILTKSWKSIWHWRVWNNELFLIYDTIIDALTHFMTYDRAYG